MPESSDKIEAMIDATKSFTVELVKMNSTQDRQLEELKNLGVQAEKLEQKFTNGFKSEIISAINNGHERWRSHVVSLWIAVLSGIGVFGVLAGIIMKMLPNT